MYKQYEVPALTNSADISNACTVHTHTWKLLYSAHLYHHCTLYDSNVTISLELQGIKSYQIQTSRLHWFNFALTPYTTSMLVGVETTAKLL